MRRLVVLACLVVAAARPADQARAKIDELTAKLMPPFERYNDRSFACPARPRYHGSGRIEGYWDVLFCEPCLTPRREVDKRISRRRLQDALHIDASH